MAERKRWSPRKWEEYALALVSANRIQANQKFSKIDTVIYTFANYGAQEFLMNWVASLMMTNHTRFVVFCFDIEMYTFLLEHGFEKQATMIPERWTKHKSLPLSRKAAFENMTDFQALDTPNYKYLTLVRHLVTLNVWRNLHIAVLSCDADVVFLSPHVIDYIVSNHEVEGSSIVFQKDENRDLSKFHPKPITIVKSNNKLHNRCGVLLGVSDSVC